MTDKEKIPTVEYSDQVKEAMARDPALAEAMRDMASTMRNALQAVEDGRYRTFAEAMEDMTGRKPERLTPEEAEEEVAKAKKQMKEKS